MPKTSKSDNRVSIEKHLIPWLKELGVQALGTDDLTKIVNHMLACQRMGCFGIPQHPTAAPISQQASTLARGQQMDNETLADSLSDLLAA